MGLSRKSATTFVGSADGSAFVCHAGSSRMLRQRTHESNSGRDYAKPDAAASETVSLVEHPLR